MRYYRPIRTCVGEPLCKFFLWFRLHFQRISNGMVSQFMWFFFVCKLCYSGQLILMIPFYFKGDLIQISSLFVLELRAKRITIECCFEGYRILLNPNNFIYCLPIVSFLFLCWFSEIVFFPATSIKWFLLIKDWNNFLY